MGCETVCRIEIITTKLSSLHSCIEKLGSYILLTRPVLSIVVPTCDRPDTLEVCLQALMNQPNPDVEIVIQDNASDARTLAIIAANKDPRIVHRRSESRISMRNNFEDGVAAATGDYVTIIGDDDAFCAGALDWLVGMLKEYKPLAIRWNLAAYYWPTLSDANLGYVHLHYHYFYGGWSWGDARDVCQKMLDGTMAGLWESLQLYHGVVSRKLCEETREKTDGTLFQYHIPDVYVHTAILLTAGAREDRRYIDVKHPLSIYGMSGHSNGSSWYAAKAEKRGEKSPMANWEKTVAADTKLKSKVLNPIRCVKYHDYAALMVADSLGLVGDRVIDHHRWRADIIKEVEANRWQLYGFYEAEPSIPYEHAIINAVKSTLGPLEKLGEVKGPRLLQHVYEECWRFQQLCITSAEPDLPDNVATAVKVLDEITISSLGLRHDSLISERKKRELRANLQEKIKQKYHANPPKIALPEGLSEGYLLKEAQSSSSATLLSRARRMAGRIYRQIVK